MKLFFRALFIAVIAALIALSISALKTARDVESFLFDIRHVAFHPETPASADIVMVWLDEDTMQGLPYRSPIPRDFLAKLHTKIAEASPKLIAYDIFFKDPSFPAVDEELSAAFKEFPPYSVVPMRGDGSVDATLEMFSKVLAGVGLADLPFNPFDATVRSARLDYETKSGRAPTFAALLYSAARGQDAETAFQNGPSLEMEFYIRFAGKPSTIGNPNNVFKTYSAKAVAEGLVPKAWLKDKLVLVGAGYDDLKDAYLTPYYMKFTDYARMNGIEVHANILSGLMTGSFYYVPVKWETAAFAFTIAILIAAAAVKSSPWGASFAWLGLAAIWAVLSVAVFHLRGIVMPMVPVFLSSVTAYGAGLGWKALTEGRQKRFIRGVFARYVPQAVVARMTEHPELLKLGGEERVVTSLFSDIASFTNISEKMAPQMLVQFLNEYLGRMNAVLFEFGATLDKYEGDAIIAFFNAPLDVEHHEEMAVRAAIKMKRASEDISKLWREKCGREIVTRIGINTGPAIVGNMGSEGRFDYTAIGDTINLASRLEGTNKFYGTVLMTSEMTAKKLGKDILTRPVDRVRVKGKSKPILLYEILGEAGACDAKMIEGLVRQYLRAFELFEMRKLDDAQAAVSEILRSYPNDEPTSELLKRCKRAVAEPEWDLVTELSGK